MYIENKRLHKSIGVIDSNYLIYLYKLLFFKEIKKQSLVLRLAESRKFKRYQLTILKPFKVGTGWGQNNKNRV